MLKRQLYIETHPSSWGDGLLAYRQVRNLLDIHGALSVVQHKNMVTFVDAMLGIEGIVDAFHVIPDAAIIDANLMCTFLDQEFRHINFDTLILGWCFDLDINEVLQNTNCLSQIDTLWSISHSCGEMFQAQGVPVKIPTPIESGEYYRAGSISKVVDRLWKTLPISDRYLAIHPISTRPFSQLSPSVVSKLADCLDSVIILLGTDIGYYASTFDPHFHIDHKQVFDWIGLGPLKQLEVMRRCDLTITTPTGAIVWPMLYEIPTLCIQGGEWSVAHWMKFSDKLMSFDTACDLFPCDQGIRYPKCHTKPQCLGSDLDVNNLARFIEQGFS